MGVREAEQNTKLENFRSYFKYFNDFFPQCFDDFFFRFCRSMDETDPEASTTETGTGTGSTEAETTSASTSQMSVDEDASKKQPYKLQGSAPDIATKLEDVVDELPDHVLSR